MKKSHGFTIIEILVALAIFAILGVIASVGINTALKTRDAALASNQRLFELQQAYLLLQNDLNQAVVRTAYDGARRLPPFATGNDGHTLMAFTRAGVINPLLAEKRSQLQWVAYRWQQNTLWRDVADAVDRAPNSKIASRPLLTHVTHAQVRLINTTGGMQDTWTMCVISEAVNCQNQLPHGAELTLTLDDLKEITWVFMLPGAQNASL